MVEPSTDLFAFLPELEEAGARQRAEAKIQQERRAAAERQLPWAHEVQTMLLAEVAGRGWPTTGTFRAWEGNGFAGPATVKPFTIWHQPCGTCGEEMLLLQGARDRRPGGRHVCRQCKADRKRTTDTARKRRQRAAATPDPTTTCAHCGETFLRKRKTAQFCSARCRVAAHRSR